MLRHRTTTALTVWMLLCFMAMNAHAATTGVVVANIIDKNNPVFGQWQEFRRSVDEKSDGTLLLDYLIFGELGSSSNMLKALESGRADIGGFSCASITSELPELAVTAMPYLFSSDREAAYVLDYKLTPLFQQIADQHGLVFLQWSDYGWMDFYSKQAVRLPAQLAGQPVRTTANISGPVYLRALGATPVELTASVAASNDQAQKLFGAMGNAQTLQKYGLPDYGFLTRTHHSYNCGMLLANKAWFEAATPKERDIIRTSFLSPDIIRGRLKTYDETVVAAITRAGVTVLELNAEQHNAWAAAGLPLYPKIIQEAGGRSVEVYDAIRDGKRDFLRQSAPPAK